MVKQLLLLTTLLLCCRIIATAQDNQDSAVLRINGVIRDSTTGEAVPYATITLPLNDITTMSNDAGVFTLIIPAAARRDTIRISHIGYRPTAFLLPALSRAGMPDAGILTFTLPTAPVQLPDVTVRSASPMTIIDKAISRIPFNYPTRPFIAIGFYRKDSYYHKQIIEISEAVFDIYSPDNNRQTMQFRLIKARADRDLTAFAGLDYSFGMRPDDLMDRDMVSRIHQTQILGDKGRDDHEFSYGGIIDFEGAPAYVIDFDEKAGIPRPLYKGRIVIDTATLAFLSFDYGLSPKGLAYRPNGRGPWHNEVTGNHLTIRYRPYGEKYYLHYVTIETRIHPWSDGPPPMQFDTSLTRLNYLITIIDTGLVAFSRTGKHIDNSKAIETQLHENTKKGAAYWDNYNLIQADYNVDSALNMIRHNNGDSKKTRR